MNELAKVLKHLAGPFDPGEVQFKVQATTRDRARGLVVTYIDARTVQERLDEAVRLGLLEDWQVEYALKEKEETPRREEEQTGRLYVVEATLTLYLPSGRTSVRKDVGEGDTLKAAYSDAFKRAAVQFGVGRYLYRLEKVWVPLQNGQIPEEEVRRLRKRLPRPGGEGTPSRAEVSPQEPSVEERLRKADRLIGDLVERLKGSGKAKEAIEVLLRHGYKVGEPGSSEEDLRRARAVYEELTALARAA